jgi:hypothetical protein
MRSITSRSRLRVSTAGWRRAMQSSVLMPPLRSVVRRRCRATAPMSEPSHSRDEEVPKSESSKMQRY